MKAHDAIKRQGFTLFKKTGKTVTVKAKNMQTGNHRSQPKCAWKLLAHSAKSRKTKDFERALTYPLYPVLLSLAFPDGTRRTTAESKFMEVILSYCGSSANPKDSHLLDRANPTYLIDLMA